MADAATQRGRGGVRGGMRGGSTDRGNKSSAATRGRGGRGRANTGLVNTRGRAAGTSARGASHIARSATISSASSGVSSSPFAQLNQSKQSRTASPFSNATSGLRQPRKESPLAAAAAADNVFNPSAAQRASKQIPNGHAHGALANQKKPEIASVSGSFQDRYEQVRHLFLPTLHAMQAFTFRECPESNTHCSLNSTAPNKDNKPSKMVLWPIQINPPLSKRPFGP